jgi:hypothetical protein
MHGITAEDRIVELLALSVGSWSGSDDGSWNKHAIAAAPAAAVTEQARVKCCGWILRIMAVRMPCIVT